MNAAVLRSENFSRLISAWGRHIEKASYICSRLEVRKRPRSNLMRRYFNLVATLGWQKLLACAICGTVLSRCLFAIGLQAQEIEAPPKGLQDSITNKSARSF